jgi:hypothetical protein
MNHLVAESSRSPAGGAVEPERLAWLEPRLWALLGPRVRSDVGERAPYTSDASNHRELPALVAEPGTIEGLVALPALCGEARVPLTMRVPA